MKLIPDVTRLERRSMEMSVTESEPGLLMRLLEKEAAFSSRDRPSRRLLDTGVCLARGVPLVEITEPMSIIVQS